MFIYLLILLLHTITFLITNISIFNYKFKLHINKKAWKLTDFLIKYDKKVDETIMITKKKQLHQLQKQLRKKMTYTEISNN